MQRAINALGHLLGSETFDAAWSDGALIPLKQLVAHTLQQH